MGVSKVMLNNETLMDVTDTTVDEDNLLSGETALGADGETVRGSVVVPTKTSDLVNDSGFISTETDPTVPSWAKAANKPSYTATEVGALPDDTVIPSKTSDLTNDSGFITGYMETDPTVPSWAKAASKPSYTASEVGALPDSTTIPSKTSDLTNDSGYVADASYVHTDNNFTSTLKDKLDGIEAGATVDDKTWNGVTLTTIRTNTDIAYYIPAKDSSTLNGQAKWFVATPSVTAKAIAKWDKDSYLYSTTPSASDNSTKVATTAYVDNAVSSVDALPSQSGQSGKFLTTDGTDASWASVPTLPSQSGNSGKFLTTDGTDASWATVTIPTVEAMSTSDIDTAIAASQ